MLATSSTRPASLVTPAFLVGLGLFVAFIAYHGAREVGAALALAGPGLLVVVLFHLLPMLGDALGWRALIRPASPGAASMLFARWVGESVNGLLPALQVGGNVAKARILVRRGVPSADAGASVVVDVTLVMATQIVFSLVGLTLLVAHLGVTRVAAVATAGTVAVTALLASVLLVQRRTPFTIAARVAGRLLGDERQGLGAGAAALDAAVARLYRDRAAILASGTWHLLAWFVGAGEIWLALRFLGHPVPIHTAVLLESLTQAARTGAFFVPGALGVQEAGLLLLAGPLGLAPDTALALSLSRRVRDLALGLPGLAAWQLDATGAATRARSERTG